MRHHGFPVDDFDHRALGLRERFEHDMRRFRIEVDIELGRRGHVAVRRHCPAHHDAAGEASRQGRVELQRQRQVGQRTERDQQQPARVLMRQAEDRECGVFGLGRACCWRIAGIAETIAAVDERRIQRRMHQWRLAAGEHRRAAAGDFAQFECIAHGVFEADITCGNGQTDNLMALVVERHQQRQCVIDARVGIDQEGDLVVHAAIIRQDGARPVMH